MSKAQDSLQIMIQLAALPMEGELLQGAEEVYEWANDSAHETLMSTIQTAREITGLKPLLHRDEDENKEEE
jgi:hypothetical protein